MSMMPNKRDMIDFMALYSGEGTCFGLAAPTSTDSYKFAHSLLYRPDAIFSQSYLESRGYAREAIIGPEIRSALQRLGPTGETVLKDALEMAPNWTHTVFFGGQMLAKKYFTMKITVKMVQQAAKLARKHGLPYPEEGWMIIATELGGKLPIQVRMLPEGTVCNLKNALCIIENTDPRFAWLPSFLETMIVRGIWYPVTVATLSFQIKLRMFKALCACCETVEEALTVLLFMLHDFGARGVSSSESAQIGGAAHLVNFMGSDTFESIIWLMQMYNLPYLDQMPAFSIPATEHSTMTGWGGPKFETKAFENMIDMYGPSNALIAIVSDSYDLEAAVKEKFGETLKSKILKTGNTLVVRPDSGDPEVIPVMVLEWLWEKFGGTVNSKGYKVLNPAVKVIQGDGINERSIAIILKNTMAAKFSVQNLAFGMGGALLQQLNRDTLKFAQKTCAMRVDDSHPEIGYPDGMTDDGWFDVQKDPKTDPGKRSKAGRLAVVQTGPVTYETVRIEDLKGRPDALRTVFLNGEVIEQSDFIQVRERAQAGFLALFQSLNPRIELPKAA